MNLYSVVVAVPRDWRNDDIAERLRRVFMLDRVIDANQHTGPLPIDVPLAGALVLASDGTQLRIPAGVVTVHYKAALRRMEEAEARAARMANHQPAIAGGAVATQWRSYRANVMPGRIPAVQEIECKRAFYAGAHALFAEVIKAAEAPETEDQQVARMDAIKSELEEFAAAVARGEA